MANDSSIFLNQKHLSYFLNTAIHYFLVNSDNSHYFSFHSYFSIVIEKFWEGITLLLMELYASYLIKVTFDLSLPSKLLFQLCRILPSLLMELFKETFICNLVYLVHCVGT